MTPHTLTVTPHSDPPGHYSTPVRAEPPPRNAGESVSEGQQVITFSGNEVERPRLFWECRDDGTEEPDQQEEGGRGHGRHHSPTMGSVDVFKERGTEGGE